jgi:molybdopterin converting factor small subunit
MPTAKTETQITVHFYSFFKDLAGCVTTPHSVPSGTTLSGLTISIIARFPKLEPMKKSMLIAVGVEYQDRSYILNDGDEVSLFPPVQGG